MNDVRKFRSDPGEDVSKDFARQLGKRDDDGVDDVADVVEVSLKMKHEKTKESEEHEESEENHSFSFDETFELSYMDSPYIDNIWVLHEDGRAHRIAVLLKEIDKCPKENEGCEYRVEVEILHFPSDLFLPVEQPPPAEVVKGSHSD